MYGIIRSGDVAPQVLLTESKSGSKIPGYAIVFYTEKPTVNTIEWREVGGKGFRIEEKELSN
jgi:hypothetical protein